MSASVNLVIGRLGAPMGPGAAAARSSYGLSRLGIVAVDEDGATSRPEETQTAVAEEIPEPAEVAAAPPGINGQSVDDAPALDPSPTDDAPAIDVSAGEVEVAGGAGGVETQAGETAVESEAAAETPSHPAYHKCTFKLPWTLAESLHRRAEAVKRFKYQVVADALTAYLGPDPGPAAAETLPPMAEVPVAEPAGMAAPAVESPAAESLMPAGAETAPPSPLALPAGASVDALTPPKPARWAALGRLIWRR